jgi:hypothetical protein
MKEAEVVSSIDHVFEVGAGDFVAVVFAVEVAASGAAQAACLVRSQRRYQRYGLGAGR